MDTRKQNLLNCIKNFIGQRAGLEFGNYGEISSYRQEQRRITKDRHHAEALINAVAWRDSITADNIIEASKRAYSGRLSIIETGDGAFRIEYCTGQYFPTEYRAAACAVLAQALWYAWRSECPKDHAKPGEYIRHQARCCFGRSIQKRWLD